MIFILIQMPSDIEKALIYKSKPDTQILNEFRKKYQDIEWVFEFLYQRDFLKFDIEKLIKLNAKKQYITTILNFYLQELSKKNLKDSLRKVYKKYKNYFNAKSYEILYFTLREKDILIELVNNFPRTELAYKFLNELKLSQLIKAQILYHNEKYKDLIEQIRPESALYFYVDALSKLYDFKGASEICKKHKTTNLRKSDYFFKCILNLLE
ncbi:MAG: hypothetical protein ABIL37_05465, partial [candidate division WOR-3 bacterium]